ncbi:MAG: Na+/H+ antiporter NhaA [Ilumatobacteraceae bacterium]
MTINMFDGTGRTDDAQTLADMEVDYTPAGVAVQFTLALATLLPWYGRKIVALDPAAGSGVWCRAMRACLPNAQTIVAAEPRASELGAAFSNRVTWGVVLGLVVGKTIGISGATLVAVLFRVARLPQGVTVRYVIGAGALGGIGFTVSLFVTELAFGEAIVGTDARLGVLVGSLIAALIGTAILLPGEVVVDRSMDDVPETAEILTG